MTKPIDPNNDDDEHGEHIFSVVKLTKDLTEAAKTMSGEEARYLVDAFYLTQDDRKRAHNQVRAMGTEPHEVIKWLATQSKILEAQIKNALDHYTDAQPAGEWMKSIYGVGPIIAAGLLAHIDIERSPTVGHIYSFAGIAGKDQKKWEKGQKRPFNAALKTLTWKTGQCFMKFSGDEACTYGHLYKERKAYEVKRNDAGDHTELCKEILAAKRFNKDTDAFKHYTAGHLPPAHVDARARRFAVKIFLSHLHCVMTWLKFNRLPPNPYAIDHLTGHTHFRRIWNSDGVPGLTEALRNARLIH